MDPPSHDDLRTALRLPEAAGVSSDEDLLEEEEVKKPVPSYLALAGPVVALALLAGLLFQFSATVISGYFAVAGNPNDYFKYQADLVYSTPGWSHLFARNLVPLACFAICGLLLSGWRPLDLAIRRRVGATLGVLLVVIVFWRVIQQTADLVTLISNMTGGDLQTEGSSLIFLMICQPHGPLEFAALLLPLVAALYLGSGGTRNVVRLLPVSVLLLMMAAIVESRVSPHLVDLIA